MTAAADSVSHPSREHQQQADDQEDYPDDQANMGESEGRDEGREDESEHNKDDSEHDHGVHLVFDADMGLLVFVWRTSPPRAGSIVSAVPLLVQPMN
jgi:hypothetical protein